MKRGDVVLIRQPGTPSSKPRPCVVVQRDVSLAGAMKVTVCPLTTQLRGVEAQRPFVAPDAGNGLRRPSEVQVDWLYTHPIGFLSAPIGSIDQATMREVDRALSRWLDL